MTTKSSQKVLGCADQRWRCPGHKLVCEGCCWAVGPMKIGTLLQLWGPPLTKVYIMILEHLQQNKVNNKVKCYKAHALQVQSKLLFMVHTCSCTTTHVSWYHLLQASQQTIFSLSNSLQLQKTATASFLRLSLFLILRFFKGNGFILFEVKQEHRWPLICCT